MRILVTGGAGFIGHHLVAALIERGDEAIVADLKRPEDRPPLPEETEILEVDLRRADVARLVAEIRPDAIVHLAANANVAKSMEDPAGDAETNHLLTVRLLEAAGTAHVPRFVFASTGGALSAEDTALPTPESKPARPRSPYAAHKLSSEFLGTILAAARGFRFTALRFANVYGPGQRPTLGEANVIATFARRIVTGEDLRINGDGLQTRDYVYVDDVVDALLLAIDRSEAEGVFNVGTGIETSVIDIHRSLMEISGQGHPARFAPGQRGEPRRSALDISKARNVLGWHPQTTLAEGLRRTFAWYRKTYGGG